jgi:hypothetical protein
MDDWIKEFAEKIDEAAEMLLLIPMDQSMEPLSAGKWSARQVIGHLIDSAANNHRRFVEAQFRDDLDFPGYNQEQWVAAQRYNEQPWPQLVSLWRNYNLHLAHVMAAVPIEIRQKPRAKHSLHAIAWETVSPSDPVTLEYLMRDYVGHLKNHLKQIFTNSDLRQD